jgi:hypothetical protein
MEECTALIQLMNAMVNYLILIVQYKFFIMGLVMKQQISTFFFVWGGLEFLGMFVSST